MNREEAERLYSRHLDDELQPDELSALCAYMDENPDFVNGLESWKHIGDQLREEVAATEVSVDEAWLKIQARIDDGAQPAGGKVMTFSRWQYGWGIAAAIALLAFTLASFYKSVPTSLEGAAYATDVEYVETDIPGASSIVFVDEASGWTIVWVDEPETSEI